MKNAFTRAVNTTVPQNEPANSRQVKNNAGGYVYAVSDETRLVRFLVLGTTGGTYYQGEKDLTKQNLDFLLALIKRDPMLVISKTAEISDEGRAYKNSPAIFTMALVYKNASEDSKAAARKAGLKVCRTATHLFEFGEYVELLGANSYAENLAAYNAYAEAMKREAETLAETIGKRVNPMRRFSGSATGGWSRGTRGMVADWYEGKTPDQLAYQAVKYRQRNGWTHKDLFRLSHPKGVDKNVGNFILGKSLNAGGEAPKILYGFNEVQKATTVTKVLGILDQHKNLPWEALPTQFHKDAEIWKKLFYNGQLKGQALVRNITRLARIGAFDDMVFARDYADRLSNEEMIQQARMHPVNYLNAIVVYTEGQIDRKGYGVRKKDWNTTPVILDALNDGFYKSFKYVEPAGKRTFIAIDVSPSMDSPAMGLDLHCSQVAGAMAMSVARTEPYYMIRGFASAGRTYGYGRQSGLKDLGISPSMRLDDVMRKMQDASWGGTDCALPMKYAMENKLEIDTFLILTDNDTWAGDIHADEMLRRYRQHSGIDARMIVAGMTATNFTIADPNDAGMMDVCGADANLPRLVSDFSAGRL